MKAHHDSIVSPLAGNRAGRPRLPRADRRSGAATASAPREPRREDRPSESAARRGGRLVVRKGRRLLLLSLADIRYAEAAGNYVRLHLDGASHLHRSTMNDLETLLEPHGFLRIHRSTVVQLDHIAEIRTTPAGEYEAVLRCGTMKRWSRGYRDRLDALR